MTYCITGENPGPGTPASLSAPDNVCPPGPPGGPQSAGPSTPGLPQPHMGPAPPFPPASAPEGAPFMQQQSQLFVFSTSLANKAAEGVQAGQYKSIIDYHMDQPSTKQYLQVTILLLNNTCR